MTRLGRWAFNIASAISLLLCVLIAWDRLVGSNGIRERCIQSPWERDLGIESLPTQGWLQLSYTRPEFADPGARGAFWSWSRSVAHQGWRFYANESRTWGFTPQVGKSGVAWETFRDDGRRWYPNMNANGVVFAWSSFRAPHWVWLSGMAHLPLLRLGLMFRRLRQLKRMRAGHCRG